MGAKQSKRSVDISGKEVEGASEVAAAGAVVEGRVEALADVDALKPQLNGDAHIHEQTEKEKQLDSGTPENEKDATTEKEGKEESEKETAPVTNGDSEPKGENGDSTPTPEEGKKPKKEKVKKKWSLRSISFSRKDKPKQEKKQKEDETKTNGEPEKVPEEAAEATPETAVNDVPQEGKIQTEVKEEKTPETPVTEPLTNGSSTPESPKVETPPAEEPASIPAPTPATAVVATVPEPEKLELKVETQPEQLPVNGLSLEEIKPEVPQVAQVEESKPEEQPTAETTEIVPAPEIPVKKEVCSEQMPLESTPPPLPANPPPSSVAFFAATTMAPELTDASLANTAELVISAPHSVPDNKAENKLEATPAPPTDLTNTDNVNTDTVATVGIVTATKITAIQVSPVPLKESTDEKPIEAKIASEIENVQQPIMEKIVTSLTSSDIVTDIPESNVDTFDTIQTDHVETKQATGDQLDVTNVESSNQDQLLLVKDNISETEIPIVTESLKTDQEHEIPEPITNIESLTMIDTVEDLPPPPPPIVDEIPLQDDIKQKNDVTTEKEIVNETVVNSNHISENTDINGVNAESLNGNDEMEHENLKNKTKDLLGNVIVAIECNGNIENQITKQEMMEAARAASNSTEESGAAVSPDDSLPPSLSEANESLPAAEGGASNEVSEAFPPPPSELCRSETESTPPASPGAPAIKPQEPLPVSDKLADLIPEVPVVPELNTETLQKTTSDVAVTN